MSDGSDGSWFCRTADDRVVCGTSRRATSGVEVTTDRCLAAFLDDAELATPWQITVTVPTYLTTYTPADARQLAASLLAHAELIERCS